MRKYLFVSILLLAMGLSAGCGSASKSTPPQPPPQPPPAPANLAATPGDGEVTLTWDPSRGASGYYLYYYPTNSAIPGNRQPLAQTTSTTYTQSPLTDGVLYEYFAAASNVAGMSSMTEAMAVPSFMTGTTFTSPSSGISLTWSAVTSPTTPSYYAIFYGPGQASPLSAATVTTAASTYTFAGLSGTYTFTVTAYVPGYPPGIRVGAAITAAIP